MGLQMLEMLNIVLVPLDFGMADIDWRLIILKLVILKQVEAPRCVGDGAEVDKGIAEGPEDLLLFLALLGRKPEEEIILPLEAQTIKPLHGRVLLELIWKVA